MLPVLIGRLRGSFAKPCREIAAQSQTEIQPHGVAWFSRGRCLRLLSIAVAENSDGRPVRPHAASQ